MTEFILPATLHLFEPLNIILMLAGLTGRDHHWGASGALRHHGGGAHGPGHVRHEPDQRPDHARRDIRWGHLWRRELGHSHLHAGHAFLRGDHVRRLAAVPEGEGGSRAVHVASVLGLRGIVGTLFLLCLGGSLARFALQFGGPESFGCVSSGSPPSR